MPVGARLTARSMANTVPAYGKSRLKFLFAHQLLLCALGTTHTQEAVGEDAAFQVRLELVLDELRQARACLRLDLGEEGLEEIHQAENARGKAAIR